MQYKSRRIVILWLLYMENFNLKISIRNELFNIFCNINYQENACKSEFIAVTLPPKFE